MSKITLGSGSKSSGPAGVPSMPLNQDSTAPAPATVSPSPDKAKSNSLPKAVDNDQGVNPDEMGGGFPGDMLGMGSPGKAFSL